MDAHFKYIYIYLFFKFPYLLEWLHVPPGVPPFENQCRRAGVAT